MLKQLCPMIAAAVLISGVLAMPAIFDEAMNNGGEKDIITIKNYNTGASLTEAYTGIKHLQRETQVKTGYWQQTNTSDALEEAESDGNSPVERQAGGLEASINSNVIGRAHIAWQSYDPIASRMGRHQFLGRSVEDLTGVFSIEKFIQLWSGSSPGEISIEWLPCS